ncbi:hypothetical protein DL768_004843 [Monosporascus sp. mg162]|nr:hypothetical protein DL768_004843 [Monosporascus sp. mg162]
MAMYRRQGAFPRYYKPSHLTADRGASLDYSRAGPTYLPSFPTQAPDGGAGGSGGGSPRQRRIPGTQVGILYDNVPSNNRYTGCDKWSPRQDDIS